MFAGDQENNQKMYPPLGAQPLHPSQTAQPGYPPQGGFQPMPGQVPNQPPSYNMSGGPQVITQQPSKSRQLQRMATFHLLRIVYRSDCHCANCTLGTRSSVNDLPHLQSKHCDERQVRTRDQDASLCWINMSFGLLVRLLPGDFISFLFQL